MKKGRPIPTDLRGWICELTGIHRYLKRIEMYAPSAGEKWISKQETYYKEREQLLLDNPPKLPKKYDWLKILEAHKNELVGRAGS